MWTLYFCPVISIFLLYSILNFFSSPNLSGPRLDVYHTSTHGVALVHVWNVLHSARWKYRMQIIAISAPSHKFVVYLRNQGMYWQSEKKLLNINTSSTCPHNMVNFGTITAENCWRVWATDTPANFNGFRVLAVLLHGTPAVGVSQTLRRWTEGATYIRQGCHHVGHWPTFLVGLWYSSDILTSYYWRSEIIGMLNGYTADNLWPA